MSLGSLGMSWCNMLTCFADSHKASFRNIRMFQNANVDFVEMLEGKVRPLDLAPGGMKEMADALPHVSTSGSCNFHDFPRVSTISIDFLKIARWNSSPFGPSTWFSELAKQVMCCLKVESPVQMPTFSAMERLRSSRIVLGATRGWVWVWSRSSPTVIRCYEIYMKKFKRSWWSRCVNYVSKCVESFLIPLFHF